MALSNAQYDSIIHKYDVTRMLNSRLENERKETVFATVPGYRELENDSVTLSLAMAKKKVLGEDVTKEDLRRMLSEIKAQKRKLLADANLGEDYLDPIYECKDCKDTGFIGGNKCHCFLKQETELLFNQTNIRDFLKKNNFRTLSFNYYHGDDLSSFTRAVDLCHNMVDGYATNQRSLLLFGTVGTGKSFLSGCVAYELLNKGYSVIYYSSSSLFDALAKETFSNKSKDELYNLHDYIYNCDLLIIDDLGTETTNSFVSSSLFSCINERALRRKGTIISTNLSLEEIRDRYSDRIFSRIVSSYDVCKLSGPDIRTEKRKQTISVGG